MKILLIQKNSGQYIWRTVDDDKVRGAHAALNGTVRDYADSPDPGEDFNCRCWAEPIRNTKSICDQLQIDLDNAKLQLQNEINGMLDSDKKAKRLRYEINLKEDEFYQKIQESGLDIASSYIPDNKIKIPVVEPLLEFIKGSTELLSLLKEIKSLNQELSLQIKNQNWFDKRRIEQEKKISILVKQREDLGCGH